MWRRRKEEIKRDAGHSRTCEKVVAKIESRGYIYLVLFIPCFYLGRGVDGSRSHLARELFDSLSPVSSHFARAPGRCVGISFNSIGSMKENDKKETSGR